MTERRMRILAVAAGIVLGLGMPVLADNNAGKTFSGTWTVQDSGKDGPTKWIMEQKPDSIKIAEIRNDEKLAEFECNTLGQECEVKEGGKKTKVSIWFNGPKLVELETRGSDTVKRRFAMNPNGDEMDVEVIPISPAGKTEVVQFKRVEVTAANQ